MREILFRGKRKDNGEWVEGDLMQHYVHHDDLTIVVGGCVYYEVNSETVSQFTGLTDKNGSKIFEGDIIEYKDNEVISNEGYVVFDKGSFFVETYDQDCRLDDLDEGTTIEVIGSIDDNKDLLE